jgi:hypothetical protein
MATAAETTPAEAVWIDTVRDCGLAFAAGLGVTSGDGLAIADAKDGAAVLIIAYPTRAAAAEAAAHMMTLSRLYWLDEKARAAGAGEVAQA